MTDAPQPTTETEAHDLPEEVLDVLVNLGQQHPMGKLALRCWVLGKGLPSDGGFTIKAEGTYTPTTPPPSPTEGQHHGTG